MRRPEQESPLARRFHDRELPRLHEVAQPHPQGQQVAQRDGPVRRDGVLQRPSGISKHLPVGQFGQKRVHRVVQPQPALLHQAHRGNRRDGLGDRGDPKDRVPLHRCRGSVRQRAQSFDFSLPAPIHQSHKPRHGSVLHISLKNAPHPLQPRFREPAHALKIDRTGSPAIDKAGDLF